MELDDGASKAQAESKTAVLAPGRLPRRREHANQAGRPATSSDLDFDPGEALAVGRGPDTDGSEPRLASSERDERR